MKLSLLKIALLISTAYSQPLSNESILFKSENLLFDVGQNWELLTNLGSIRYNAINSKKNFNSNDTFIAKGLIGFSNHNHFPSFHGFSIFRYDNSFYGYIYPGYTNTIRKYNITKKTVGFNSIKEDVSGLGFENNWITLQFGRGRESWGAGDDIQLALSNNSAPYDYFLMSSDFGKIRVKYIHGFLETYEENINRYITARGLEWTNKRSLILGLSETVVYSGLNRSLDIGYINPISSHLEIELNNRLNIPGDSNSNAVWQLHLDYFKEPFRVSGNYLIDEFVLDRKIQIGKAHGTAYSIRLAYSPIFIEKHLLTIYTKVMKVGTSTFRHKLGTNNFVQNAMPLGWNKGSDGAEICVGLNYYNRNNFIVSFSGGQFNSGEENIIYRAYETYEDYLKKQFPSGQINKNFYLDSFIYYKWKKYLSFTLGGHCYKNNRNKILLEFMFNINLYYMFSHYL